MTDAHRPTRGASRLETLALALPLVAAASLPALWWLVDVRETAGAQRQVDLMAGQAALRVQDFVRARLLVLGSLVHEVTEGIIVDEAQFVSHATSLQNRLGGFQAINLIDATGTIKWVSPVQRNRRALGKNVLKHPIAGSVAKSALDQGEARLTPPLMLFQGMRGFASYFPIEGGAGAINGVFDAKALVQTALRYGLLSDYDVRLEDQGEVIFTSPDFEAGPSELATRRTLMVLDRAWHITLRPAPHTVATLRPRDHDLWAAIGMLACVVLAGFAIAWRGARRKERALAVRHQALEVELRHGQKMEALGRLAGGLAHDFNNLLTALMGHAELASMQEDLDPETRESLGEIIAVSKRGAKMTRSLLAFSRKQPVQNKHFDPAASIASMQPTLRHLARDSITLHADLEEGRGLVDMDPTQLDQIVMNLVVNAVDAMPEGGQLSLRVRAPRESPEWFVVEVSDSGEGMSQDVQDRVFEPFFTTKDEHGTGLGLSQVWDFARRAGGKVTVVSKAGQGTTFEVWLPRLEEGRPDPSEELPVPASRGSGRVLLIEDEHEVRRALAAMLERSGYEVVEADSLAAARAHLAEAPSLDAVVSDVKLTDGRGPELGAELRARYPDVPLIFCSGHADPEDVARIEELGATFFAKPFPLRALIEHLDRTASGSQAAAV